MLKDKARISAYSGGIRFFLNPSFHKISLPFPFRSGTVPLLFCPVALT